MGIVEKCSSTGTRKKMGKAPIGIVTNGRKNGYISTTTTTTKTKREVTFDAKWIYYKIR